MEVKQVIPKDAIPSIDEPEFTDDYFGSDDDNVIVFSEGGETRAYPTRILNYHEIVNDSIGGREVAVTWCPLCGSGIVYGREVDGRTLTFGVSGKLADDDLVMYDRETGSEWKQSSGVCIRGEFEGRELSALPANVTTWEKFEREYDGKVLKRPGGKSEASGEGPEEEEIEYDDEPYRDYFESDGFGLGAHRGQGSRDWRRDDIGPKDVVLGIETRDDALGFPMGRVEDEGGVVTAEIGDKSVVVFVTSDGIHAFENPGYYFEDLSDDRFESDGAVWDGATGESDDGRSLERVPAKRMFAFAWQDNHGEDSFYSRG